MRLDVAPALGHPESHCLLLPCASVFLPAGPGSALAEQHLQRQAAMPGEEYGSWCLPRVGNKDLLPHHHYPQSHGLPTSVLSTKPFPGLSI